MGQDDDTGQLSFNIFRLGDIREGVSVSWRLEGSGVSPVTVSDFAPGTALSGRVTFAEGSDDDYDAEAGPPPRDRQDNVRTITLDVVADGLAEPLEGYRIILENADGNAVLGTAEATGTLDDELVGVSGPVTGTPGPDTLQGTDQSDTIDALGGNDVLRGLAGDDVLNAGDGTDTINGGPGNDSISGGETSADRRDTIFGGDGNDSIDAGHGNDLVYGQDGNDTIAGGFGADELFGQNGDDVITGSAFSDLVFGGAGDDFVNGGFGFDRINGGTGADKFFHAAADGHGSDWLQDYSAAEGDMLVFGGAGATASDFVVRFAHTATPEGERSGDDGVEEAFVNFRGQTLWALVDGGAQTEIVLQIGADTFDIL